eukprot:5255882-Pleurochrysis_carterae.AAC.2
MRISGVPRAWPRGAAHGWVGCRLPVPGALRKRRVAYIHTHTLASPVAAVGVVEVATTPLPRHPSRVAVAVCTTTTAGPLRSVGK